MEEKIKNIVSIFIKVPSDQIGPSTSIGRGAVKSSILLHRMYAKLQEEGIVVDNYGEIRTFSDLLDRNRTNGITQQQAAASIGEQVIVTGMGGPGPAIGIDIEEVAAMPVTHDFRKEAFYTMNFTPSEIAYCILQADAYASFAGLFSAKEAMVKAGLRARPFNTIDIGHTTEGKPVVPDFQLSISHAGPMAVAVAVATDVVADRSTGLSSPSVKAGGRSGGVLLVSWLALLLSLLAIILIFTR